MYKRVKQSTNTVLELVKNTEVAFQYYKANAWELKSEREKPCVINAVELPLEEVGANFITRF